MPAEIEVDALALPSGASKFCNCGSYCCGCYCYCYWCSRCSCWPTDYPLIIFKSVATAPPASTKNVCLCAMRNDLQNELRWKEIACNKR